VGPAFKHILCPVDFTDKNTAALDVVFEMAANRQAQVTLLHVIERIEHAEDAETKQFFATLEAKARTNMAVLAQRFVDAGLEIATQIIYGRRGPEIVRHTLEANVDLVVLSSHKVAMDQMAGGWATLSYQVSILCPCPVLLVK
jgi:nucleotide-binding universal stress UspA family protein